MKKSRRCEAGWNKPDAGGVLENTASLVAPGGALGFEFYNNQDVRGKPLKKVKATGNRLSGWLRPLFAAMVMAPWQLKSISMPWLKDKLCFIRERYFGRERGMDFWNNMVDWVGRYPFEVASPDSILNFARLRGFNMTGLKTCADELGCNEFIIEKI